jgi:hypothetical protein
MYGKKQTIKVSSVTLPYPRRFLVFENRQVSWLMVIAPYAFPSFDSDNL